MALKSSNAAGYVLGIDLGGTKMAGAIADPSGDITVKSRQPSRADGESTVERLVRFAESLVKMSGVSWQDLEVVSVGVPGVTDVSRGIVKWAPALGWKDVPLRQLLVQEFGVPVIVENDVNMMTLGEYCCGEDKGKDPLFCVAIGTGIGGGLILGGRLHRGFHGAAGEVGYMAVERSCVGNDYRGFGCLERLISGSGMVRRAQRICWVPAEKPAGPSREITAEMILSAGRAGDPMGERFLRDLTDYLTMTMVNIMATVDPEVVVVGGGVSQSVGIFIDKVRENVAMLVPAASEIRVSSLGQDAGLIGTVAAARHFLDVYCPKAGCNRP